MEVVNPALVSGGKNVDLLVGFNFGFFINSFPFLAFPDNAAIPPYKLIK